MKKLLILILALILLIIAVFVFFVAELGFMPGLSSILGSDKPIDLNVKYSTKDLSTCREKSGLKYETLSGNPSPRSSFVFSGERQVKTEFTSEEITASMNNQYWKYWPYKSVQVKFNGDGTAEMSGIFDKSKLSGYGEAINAPKEAVEFAAKYFPGNPVFYVKLKATLVNNNLGSFDPKEFKIGRVSMPISLFLSLRGVDLVKSAYAQSMEGELAKVSGKKQMIIDFINQRVTSDYGKFYAKSAYFGDNKLFFEGTLSEIVELAR